MTCDVQSYGICYDLEQRGINTVFLCLFLQESTDKISDALQTYVLLQAR